MLRCPLISPFGSTDANPLVGAGLMLSHGLSIRKGRQGIPSSDQAYQEMDEQFLFSCPRSWQSWVGNSYFPCIQYIENRKVSNAWQPTPSLHVSQLLCMLVSNAARKGFEDGTGISHLRGGCPVLDGHSTMFIARTSRMGVHPCPPRHDRTSVNVYLKPERQLRRLIGERTKGKGVCVVKISISS